VGPTTSAVNGLFPDRSAHEIEVISDYGFSVIQTLVIPSRSPARVYCFIPQRQILSEPYSKISDDTSKWGGKALKFQDLQKGFFVEIAGMHVTQAKGSPTLTSLSPDTVQASAKAPIQISLVGTSFDQVRFVQLGEDTKARYLLDPTGGSATAATISITDLSILSANSNAPVTLSVYLITITGEKLSTSKQFTITPASPSQPGTAQPGEPQPGPAQPKPTQPNPAPHPSQPGTTHKGTTAQGNPANRTQQEQKPPEK